MNKLYKEEDIQAIGNAIRTKGGTSALLKVEDMAQAIADIPEPTGTETIIENGTYNISDKKYVAVNVPSEGITPTGTIEITENGIHDITEYAKAYVNVSGGQGGVIRDSIVIPDTYNTGCKGGLTLWSEAEDTSNLAWRDTCQLDFNNGKCLRNLTDGQTVVFNDIDFTETKTFLIHSATNYTPSSTYYHTGIKIQFNNCKFIRFESAYEFAVSNDVIVFEFNNCTIFGSKMGNAVYNNCRFGGATDFRANVSTWDDSCSASDVLTPLTNSFYNNCYIYDCEDKWTGTAGQGHIDGLQTNVPRQNTHLYNCRFECYDMPYTKSQGNWSYNIFWQHENANSSIEYTICNGGSYYGLAITKADNQILSNNQVSRINLTNAYYPNPNCYQEIDNVFSYTDKLYVSSIFEDDDHINIVYSNDTQSDRTLTVKVNGSTTYTYNVPCCPSYTSDEHSAIVDWDDLPFDKVAVINKAGVSKLEVYDGDTLIRTYGQSSPSANILPLSATANGTYTAPSGVDGYNPVTVNVPSSGIVLPDNMMSGTVTVSEVTNTLVINHNAGVIPLFYFVMADDQADTGTPYTEVGMWGYRVMHYGYNGAKTEGNAATELTATSTENTLTYTIIVNNYKFRPNITYRWFIYKEVTV